MILESVIIKSESMNNLKEEGFTSPKICLRRNRFSIILRYPGSHLRQIKREVDVSMGVVQYHLYSLEGEKEDPLTKTRSLQEILSQLGFRRTSEGYFGRSLAGNGARFASLLDEEPKCNSKAGFWIFQNFCWNNKLAYEKARAIRLDLNQTRGSVRKVHGEREFRGDFEVTPEFPSKRLGNLGW